MFSFSRRHNAFPHLVGKAFWIFISLLLVGCGVGSSGPTPASVSATGTPGAEASVGERLFLETRFAQAFKVFLDNGGNINDPNAGDPVVATAETTNPSMPINPGAFNGMSTNCRACHMVDDLSTALGGGMRTYADFAPRSPIPARPDGKTHAPRNSPALVNSALARTGGVLFHFDAEFNSMEDLIAATFTGRNFGWLPGERAQAIAHIARVAEATMEQTNWLGTSKAFLIASCSPGLTQTFRMSFVCLRSFGPLLGPEPIRTFLTQWSRWSLPM